MPERQRGAPGLAHGRIAAWELKVAEVSVPVEAAVPGDEKLAAPDLPVRAVAGAIERDADDVAIEAVLGHAARDMRVVMLHGAALDAVETQRPFRALVQRV